MSSQVTSREEGVSRTFTPQRDAEYKTLQEQIDEDAVGIAENDRRIRAARDLIADLKSDNKTRRERRTRNIQRKRVVLRTHYDLLLIEEQ